MEKVPGEVKAEVLYQDFTEWEGLNVQQLLEREIANIEAGEKLLQAAADDESVKLRESKGKMSESSLLLAAALNSSTSIEANEGPENKTESPPPSAKDETPNQNPESKTTKTDSENKAKTNEKPQKREIDLHPIQFKGRGFSSDLSMILSLFFLGAWVGIESQVEAQYTQNTFTKQYYKTATYNNHIAKYSGGLFGCGLTYFIIASLVPDFNSNFLMISNNIINDGQKVNHI